MATVVFDNNEGAGDGNWSTTTNWVGDALPGDADTAQISADCTMDVSDTVAAFIVDSGKTLTLTAGVTLSISAKSTINGQLVMTAGSTIDHTANTSVVITCGSASSITVNGTAWTAGNFCTITASNAGSTALLTLAQCPTYDVRFLDLIKTGVTNNALNLSSGFFDNCNQDGANKVQRGFLGSNAYAGNRVVIRNSCICGNTVNGILMGPMWELRNVVLGYDRAGNAKPNGNDLSLSNSHYMRCRDVFCGSSNTLSGGPTGIIEIDGVYATGAGTTEYGTRGSSLYHDVLVGNIERSTSNPPSGKTYHARLTPVTTNGTNSRFLEFSVSVPVVSGDNISVTAKASRSGDSSDCADVVIDPEGAWFTPTTVAWDLTNNHLAGTGASTNAAPGTTLTYATGGFDTIGIVDGTTKVNITAGTGATPGQYTITGHTDTTLTLATSPGASATAIAFTVERYYDLPTCAATGAGGTGAKGTVRVVFRMKEYSAAQYLDIGDITITCGGTAYVVSMQNWANGMPVPDEPAAGGGSRAVIIGG